MNKTLPEWQNEVSTWAESTFTHTEVGIVKHLICEVAELAVAIGMGETQIERAMDVALEQANKKFYSSKPLYAAEEAADVLILNLALAGYLGFSLEDAVIQKHSVNLLRKWGKPDAEGVTEHVRA